MENESCAQLFRAVIRDTRPEKQLGQQFKEVEMALIAGNGLEPLRELSDSLIDDASKLGSDEYSEKVIELSGLYTIFSINQKNASFNLDDWLNKYRTVAANIIEKRSSIRPGLDEFVAQDHKEMLHFVKDLPETVVSTLTEARRTQEFSRYIRHRNFTKTMTRRDLKEEQVFHWWMITNFDFKKTGRQTFDELYEEQRAIFKDNYKKMKRKDRNALELKGREFVLDQYNKLIDRDVDDSFNEENLKNAAVLFTQYFKDLEPRFEGDRFLNWLFKEGELSEENLKRMRDIAKSEGFGLKLGDFFRESYRNFAGFQTVAPFKDTMPFEKTKDAVRNMWHRFARDTRSCESLDCINKRSYSGWQAFFKSGFYKDSLSCLKHNPIVLKSMVMDVAMVWGAFYMFYKDKPEAFQRFPVEVIVNGAIMAPLLAETNCRASFKNALPLGTKLPYEKVFPSGLTRFGRQAWRFNGVAFKGLVTSAGLLTITMGVDNLLLALGHSIAKPLNLNAIMPLMPATYLFGGLWYAAKHLTVLNPIRHRIIPRMADILSRNGKRGPAFWVLQTGLDGALFYALVTYNEWEYLNIYEEKVVPFIERLFTSGVDIEHSRKLSEENGVEDTFEGTSEMGVETETTLVENDGEVKVEDTDIEIPDDALQEWASKILEGLPE